MSYRVHGSTPRAHDAVFARDEIKKEITWTPQRDAKRVCWLGFGAEGVVPSTHPVVTMEDPRHAPRLLPFIQRKTGA